MAHPHWLKVSDRSFAYNIVAANPSLAMLTLLNIKHFCQSTIFSNLYWSEIAFQGSSILEFFSLDSDTSTTLWLPVTQTIVFKTYQLWNISFEKKN